MAVRRGRANNNERQSRDRTSELERRRTRGITVAIYLTLIAITLAVFAQTSRFDFVNFDDDLYVYNAPLVKAGLTVNGIWYAFTSSHARNWHPLTTFSHMLDYQLWGLQSGGHHATNVLLHTIAVLLLFRVLQLMTGALWQSAVVAALFAIHPLHVESVAWISERKDVLSAVFFFFTLDAYVRYARNPSLWRYLLVVILFAAGLMSKPMLVTTPVILILLDYWPLNRIRSRTSKVRSLAVDWAKPHSSKLQIGSEWAVGIRLTLEKVPLLLLSAGSCLITFAVQKRATGAIPDLPWLWRAENAAVSCVVYMWQTLWPARLAAFYPHPNNTLPAWEISLAIALLAGTSVAAIVVRRERPYFFTGWFWYVVMLAPVIGVVEVGEQSHADRYTYLPQIGLLLLAVWGFSEIMARRRLTIPMAVATAAVVIFGFACAAFVQTRYWRNSETLWTHALAVTSDNDFAHNNLAYLLADRGQLDNAISHFEDAARIRSRKTDKHYNAGSAFVEMNLADALARKGRSDEAMLHYDQAIRLEPNYADAYYNRGNVLFAQDRIDEAIADWERTLQLQPNDAGAQTCLGNALLRKGSLNEAIAHYEVAVALDPRDPLSRNNLGWILATSSDATVRNGAKAVDFAQQAVALSESGEPQFIRTLAAAYAETGRFSDAIAAAQQAAAMADTQGKHRLANHIEQDLVLYRAHLPRRVNSPGD
ncbi:MAG TPA: tetratricopeptide repeat protein [Candidatus Udaeobacter sp.]|jgi:Flp pilus assembly protein TadD|nr:tetratricopeptide repeat protein [Candidatus Udaeobacter sp.]